MLLEQSIKDRLPLRGSTMMHKYELDDVVCRELGLENPTPKIEEWFNIIKGLFEIFIYSCNYGDIHAYINKNIEDFEDEKNKKEEDIEVDEDIIKEVEEEKKNKEEEEKNKKLIIDNFNNLVQEKILTYHSRPVINLLVLKYGRLSSSSDDSIIIYDKKH